MASYIATVKFTEKGIENIQDSIKRSAAFKAAAKKMGVKISAIYWMLGPSDGAIVFDAPSDEVATAAMLRLSSHANVQTNTSRAFTATEMEKVLELFAVK